MYANAPQLGNVQTAIEDLVGFDKVLGMTDVKQGDGQHLLTVGGLPLDSR